MPGTTWSGALPCNEGPTMDRSTTTRQPGTPERAAAGFRHEALFYRGEEELLRRATTFVRDGLAAGAAGPRRRRRAEGRPAARGARRRLGGRGIRRDGRGRRQPGAGSSRPGRSSSTATPERSGCAGSASRSPPRRSGAELEECHRHEALLNVAFADAADFGLLCPYDTSALAAHVVARARHTHPVLGEDGEHAAERRLPPRGDRGRLRRPAAGPAAVGRALRLRPRLALRDPRLRRRAGARPPPGAP